MAEKSFTLLEGDVLDNLDALCLPRVDLIVSSPPYNIGKSYEKKNRKTFRQYIAWQERIADKLANSLAPNGSLCWQVGNYVQDGEIIPLDSLFINIYRERGLKLRNRIIWRFNFGLHSDRRFSGRYESLLWFTKSDSYTFNLDSVRIPQLYPGKRHSARKGPHKAGRPSGNPLGKNPSDFWEFSASRDFVESPIWDFPNVKAAHPEKTIHPCQFPIELAERCVLAFTRKGELVLDPFVGTGASLIAALKHGRKGIGIDKDAGFLRIADERLAALRRHELPMRSLGKPVRQPAPLEKVARVPAEWISG